MDAAIVIEGVIKALIVAGIWLTIVPIAVYFERKVCAWIQDRTGPNRVGPLGVLQPIADVIKFVFKEDTMPAGAHRVLFGVAPILAVITAIIATATMPFGDTLQLSSGHVIKLVPTDLDIGILWIFAIGSLAVYGILLAGWSSSNHYSFLGGLRSSAQIISYELGLTLSVVGVLIFSGSLRLREIVLAQGDFMWNFWVQPIGFLVFLVAMFAETNRNPFDLPEAESELIAGYHTEYSSMRFAMFFMAEYINMVTMSALMVTLFFGGWSLPGLTLLKAIGPNVYGLATILVFFAKTSFFLLFFIWVRWTLPRFRYDHLMTVGWKGILPLALVQVVASAVCEVFGWAPYVVIIVMAVAAFFWYARTRRTIVNTPMPGLARRSAIAVGAAES